MLQFVKASLMEANEGLSQLIANEKTLTQITSAAELLSQCFEKKGHVWSCGNGGSMCDAMHFAEELSGRFRKNRPALGAIAMADAAHLSCTANDFGFDYVFSRFLEAHGREGDVLVAISTSGNSKNVLEAAKVARDLGIKTVFLTGKAESAISSYADIEICTPAGRYADRVQELHIKVIHILIELVERKLFNETYED